MRVMVSLVIGDWAPSKAWPSVPLKGDGIGGGRLLRLRAFIRFGENFGEAVDIGECVV